MNRFLTIALFAGLLISASACNDSKTQNQTTDTAAPTANAEDTQPAKVTLVKYSDYQCPGCRAFWQFDQELKKEFGDDVKVILKHFPLSSHPYAHVAARSAEAARKQGKFQEMNDMIFEGQPVWSRGNAEAIFIGYAEDIGLDVEMFKDDMNSAEMNRIVMADRSQGRDLGVNSTPTYFINGEQLEPLPGSYGSYKAAVEEYLQD